MSENPAAFPHSYDWDDETHVNCGMRLRDYFAAKALVGIISKDWNDQTTKDMAHDAYRMADAMLAEREKASAT